MDQAKVGKFISAARKQQGLTQEQLGEKLGVTNKTISRWETGKYMPDIDKLQELSALLGVSVNELLSGERIEDASEFARKADENLVAALSKHSVFGLQDRIEYFKRKWLGDHIGLIVLWIFVLAAVCVLGICTKRPVILGIIPLAGLIVYGKIRNQMMIYVEQHSYISAKETVPEDK